MAKEDMKMDKAQDKTLIKKAFGMHDKQEHKGEKTDLSKLKKGGMAMKMKKGGMCGAKKMADGGMAMKSMMEPDDGQTKGGEGKKTKPKAYAKGGGIEVRGKTRGKMC